MHLTLNTIGRIILRLEKVAHGGELGRAVVVGTVLLPTEHDALFAILGGDFDLVGDAGGCLEEFVVQISAGVGVLAGDKDVVIGS